MNKSSTKKILNGYLFICILVLGIGYLLIYSEYSRTSLTVYMTFLCNFILILYNLCKTNKIGYSLNEMIYLFFMIFMVIAPFLQYANNQFPWWDTHLINDNIVLNANIMIFLFIVIYELTKKLPYKFRKNQKYIVNIKKLENILFFLSIVAAIYIIANTGFTNLFSRKTNNLDLPQSLGLIVSTSVRSIPLITLMIYIRRYKEYRGNIKKKIQLLILLIIFTLLFFPTGLSRYQVAVAYLAILCSIYPTFKSKYIFKYTIIIGILGIFPIINLFRNNTWDQVINLGMYVPNPVEEFLLGDFDSYSMLCRSIIYVKLMGMSYGNQLLGAILFFIPRSIWPSKAVGSGYLMAQDFGWTFRNVSCPYIAEGYLNWGILGIIVFAFVLGKLVNNLDFLFQKSIRLTSDRVEYINLYYPIILGMLFFILRGDLLSSMAYTVGHTIPIIFIYIIDKVITWTLN